MSKAETGRVGGAAAQRWQLLAGDLALCSFIMVHG
jgi:hypothetical protein